MTEKQQLLIALRTGEMPAERSREYWSEEELHLLKRLYCEDGIDISDITLQLGVPPRQTSRQKKETAHGPVPLPALSGIRLCPLRKGVPSCWNCMMT